MGESTQLFRCLLCLKTSKFTFNSLSLYKKAKPAKLKIQPNRTIGNDRYKANVSMAIILEAGQV
ncbi:hypothetical protein CNR22_10130 [Sphingobacteriaceae bacterium]|nr:hypothetical protein CNR22_10130 [Sphingobacteriaceae bacterium]